MELAETVEKYGKGCDIADVFLGEV